MIEIDFHQEALAFARENNVCPTDTTIGTIERAMQRGATIMANHAIKLTSEAASALAARHNASVQPDSGETKTIEPLLTNGAS